MSIREELDQLKSTLGKGEEINWERWCNKALEELEQVKKEHLHTNHVANDWHNSYQEMKKERDNYKDLWVAHQELNSVLEKESEQSYSLEEIEELLHEWTDDKVDEFTTARFVDYLKSKQSDHKLEKMADDIVTAIEKAEPVNLHPDHIVQPHEKVEDTQKEVE